MSVTNACNGYFSGTEVARHIKGKPITSANSSKRKFPVSHNPKREPTTYKTLLLTHQDAIERFRNETLRVYGVLEIRLSGKYTGSPREYLAGAGKGKYSVADIGTWPWVKGWSFSGFTEEELKAFPHLLQWIDRIAQRPAVQRGIGEAYQNDKHPDKIVGTAK